MKFLLFSGMTFLLMGLGSPEPTPFEWDGPYVQYKDNKVHVSYVAPVEDGTVKLTVDSSVAVADKSTIQLKVATDQPGIFFTVKLRDKITPEKK